MTLVALAAGISGCGGDKLTLPGDATPSKIVMVTGDAQAGIVGTALPLPLVVKVTDELGRVVANQNVTFTVQSGGGQVSPGSVATGSDGRASATWTLGPDAGAQQVEAQALGGGAPDNLVVAFGATAVAGSGTLIAAVSGNDQSAPVNSALADSLVVRVSDGSNNPVSGITVQWTAVLGGGSVSPATVVTGANGRAATARVLGPTSGQQSAQAAAAGLAGSPVTFVQTALASNPTTLTLVSGNGQTAPAGFEVAEDLVVKLTDIDGNGVGGAGVTWVPDPGSGTVNPQNTTTDPSGFARTRWTLGSVAGKDSLTVVFSGVTPVRFGATASADVPTKIVLQSGDNQSAIGGQDLANPLAVKVTDANNNPVENVSVSWTANGSGSVSSPTSATNAQGIAQVTRTLGLTPGTYTTTADVPGLTGTPITFTSTATVGPAAKIVVTTEPSTTATNGVALAVQPVVQVQDAAGNNVGPAGRTITAALVNASGATLNGDNKPETDATGQAVYLDLSITGPAGNYTIGFSSGSLTAALSTPIAVSAGAPSASKSTVTASPTSVAVSDPSTITVTAKDAGGNPVPDVTVTLQASGSGNSLTQPSAQTDANGQTTGSFSSTSTGSHIITATVDGTPVSPSKATVTVTAGPPASIAVQAGNNQTATAGTAVSTDPAVIVKDAGGNPVANVDVTFAVASGGGSVTGAAPKTNSSGIATVGSWTLGSGAGSNTLTATAAGSGISGNPVTFTATAIGPPDAGQSTVSASPTTITASNGSSTSTITVTAKDAAGHVIAGANVSLTPDGGGNTLSAPGPTNASGVTIATYSSTEAGNHTISATINGVGITQTATITVQAGPAANLAFSTDPPGSVSANAQFTAAVSVTDDFGNPADASVSVSLNFSLGSPTLSGTIPVSTVNGVATFSDLSVDTIGAYSLTATVSGLSPATSGDFAVIP